MSEREWPGERGPKGDHGQHGDEGQSGAVGERGATGERGGAGIAGERGQTGDMGQTGRQGQRGPANWQAYVAMGIAMIAALAVYVEVDNRREADDDREARAVLIATGRTTLSNCQQIELVKTEIRNTVQASLERLPKLDYYRSRPDELKQALKDTRASIARFASKDCYRLPAVRAAGITPPPRQ